MPPTPRNGSTSAPSPLERPCAARVILALLVAVSACEPPEPAETDRSPWAPPSHVETEVLDVVQDLFDVIEHRDIELGRRILHPGGRFLSIRESEDGSTIVQEQSHEEFLASIERAVPAFRERFWDPAILVRGDLAMVWTPYDFHVDRELSHCGVDAFTLVRTDRGWQIAATVYTVEVDTCDAPPLMSPLGPPEWEP